MPDAETIAAQKELLAAHRRTLAHLLRQAAQHGGVAFAPPAMANGIAEARAGIQRSKDALRGWGVAVEDRPDDAESELSPTRVLSPPAAKKRALVWHLSWGCLLRQDSAIPRA